VSVAGVISPRKPKQGNLVKNEDKAIWVITSDPWYKVRKYMRLLPPWSKLRGGWSEVVKRPYLKAACEAFAKVASETKGLERWARREAIARVLRDKKYVPEEIRKARMRTIRKVSIEEAVGIARRALEKVA